MPDVGDILSNVWAWIIGEWIVGIWENVFGFTTKMTDAGEKVFNTAISMCTGFILKTPAQTYPDAWNMMKDIAGNEAVRGIANDIVIVAFLVGLIGYSITERTHIELSDLIKIFARMCLANYFVFHYMELIEGIWTVTSRLVSLIGPEEDANLLGTSTVVLPTVDLLWVILALVYAVIMIVLGFRIINSFFERCLWGFLMIPFGAPAFATMVGTGHLNQTVKAYLRYMIGTALEFVAFALMIRLLGSVSGSFRATLYMWLLDGIEEKNTIMLIAVSYLGNICFASMTAGLVTKLDAQISKMLAL